MTRTVRFKAKEHATAHEAIVELNFSGSMAISINGRFFTISEAELRRLQDAGIQPTSWHHHEATCRILSVPGNV